jgi:hypothetical protein
LTSCRWGSWVRPGRLGWPIPSRRVWWGCVPHSGCCYLRRSSRGPRKPARTGGWSQFGGLHRVAKLERDGGAPGSSRDVPPFSFSLHRGPSLSLAYPRSRSPLSLRRARPRGTRFTSRPHHTVRRANWTRSLARLSSLLAHWKISQSNWVRYKRLWPNSSSFCFLVSSVAFRLVSVFCWQKNQGHARAIGHLNVASTPSRAPVMWAAAIVRQVWE